ncbi:MAG: hypothetical protein WCH43_14445, partial [Verrucomicrobiota bacterium]
NAHSAKKKKLELTGNNERPGGHRHAATAFLLTLLMAITANAQTNLIPNPGFTDSKNPLYGWRTAFPYEGWYVDNVKYVKPATMNGKSCIVIDLPPGIAGNQGGKIESAFIKAEPGATYRVEVDCMTWDFSAKLHAEAWTHDPKPINKPDKFRVPAAEDHPALVMCYRAQLPDPPDKSKKWGTVSREFTVPETVTVAGEEQKPELLSLKAVVYAGTPNGGKSYFTNFRLTKIK